LVKDGREYKNSESLSRAGRITPAPPYFFPIPLRPGEAPACYGPAALKRLCGSGNGENKESEIDMDMDIDKVKFIIETVFMSFFSVFLSIIVYRTGKKDSITSKTMTCLTDLFSDYKDTMKKINEALNLSEELRNYLKECKDKGGVFSDFNKVYYDKKYDAFRDVHYFFELLGTLIRQKEINKNTVWHCFSFPIEFFMAAKDIRDTIKNKKCLPGYAENFIWMFLFYDDRRKEKKEKWIINGEEKYFTDKEIEEYSCGYEFPEFKNKKCTLLLHITGLFEHWQLGHCNG
jgi:hypothetical protein